MKILVTGAAGAIGSHLAERLVKEGHEVVALDCFTDYYDLSIKEANIEEVLMSGASFVRLDLATDDLDRVMEGVEVIYHCAAQPGISSATPFELYERNNIIATMRLLEAAKKNPSLKLFVNVATSSIYGAYANGSEESEPRPTSHYGVTKLAAEQLVMALHRESGFPAVSLRLFSVYGERERPDKLYHKLIRAIVEGHEFPLHEGSRDHIRSYSYVGDIINGMIATLEARDKVVGQIINLGTDVTHTTGEGIDIIEEILGKKTQFIMHPPRPGDQKETTADISKARALLGYAPEATLYDGLSNQVLWYKSHREGK